jgi:hypothetical protein
MWFCLRKRKNKKAQQNAGNMGYDEGGHYHEFQADQEPKEMYAHTVASEAPSWQHQTGNHDQHIAEAPDTTSAAKPAELWHGNYNRS